MNILHLSSSYPYNDLYRNLLRELDQKGIEQTMYVALKDKNLKNKRLLTNSKSTDYIFSYPFNNIDRFIYYTKIKKVFIDLTNQVNLKKFDLVHAHFLFSDGGVAYNIKKTYGLDYIVAVRNTDLNYFFKYGIHVRNYGIKILREATKVIFLSPSYKNLLLKKYIPKNMKKSLNDKSILVPNGVDEYWLNNINHHKYKKCDDKKLRLITVGDLNRNKNILTSLKVVQLLKLRGYDVNFDIIGKGPLIRKIKDKIREYKLCNNVSILGFINDIEELKKNYRQSDIFIMPSFYETFGLVYIEAMTQGLPIIYTKNQGIDGYFNDGVVGFSVDPSSPQEIAGSIEKVLKKYNELSLNARNNVKEFSWYTISDTYINIYHSLLNKRSIL